MAIYTKTGDKGETGVIGGKRVSKADVQIEAYGNIDELTSVIGLLISQVKSQRSKVYLTQIQKDLYQIMGVLAGAEQDLSRFSQMINSFEQEIDKITLRLPKLGRFILPGGTESAAVCHIARAVCRRAERSVVLFYTSSKRAKKLEKYRSFILQYLNRLSDYLFMLARDLGKHREIVT